MVMLIALLSGFFSILFIFSKTPLLMAFFVVAQAALISFFTFIVVPTSWFSFILFMVFISAMMIIFVYVSSLASNDFFTSALPNLTWTIPIMIVLVLNFYLAPLTHFQASYSHIFMTDLDIGPSATYKLYSSYIMILTIFLIFYLLFALIVVAKNSSYTKGSLRAVKT